MKIYRLMMRCGERIIRLDSFGVALTDDDLPASDAEAMEQLGKRLIEAAKQRRTEPA